jgi:acyl carrier protein
LFIEGGFVLMTHDEVIAKINKVLIDEFEVPVDKIRPEAKINEDLGFDSLDAVDMLVLLEESVNTKIDVEKFKQVKTLNDVYELVVAIVNDQGN